MKELKLGVNIDHVATLREARGGAYPSTLDAAKISIDGGADSITVHLREDRRHIQDHDVEALRNEEDLILNLEMAATDEMIMIAKRIKPDYVCVVPEKREELTTEGGLDVVNNMDKIKILCDSLSSKNIFISLFVDPDLAQITTAKEVGADTIEIHTGHYANTDNKSAELNKIKESAEFAEKIGLQVNAGHGLTVDNVQAIAAIKQINELNIGHSIISRAVFIGLKEAVREMKECINKARH